MYKEFGVKVRVTETEWKGDFRGEEWGVVLEDA